MKASCRTDPPEILKIKKRGKEPIDWLVSVCKDCHDRLH